MVARASDSELYKDKIEVSLDGRQIFYLFFGGAVVACLVFVLGVMVGRRLEARAHVDRAAATSAVRDPLAALDRLAEGKGTMTFPAALSGNGGAAAEVDRAIAAVAEPGDKAKGKDDKAKDDKAKASEAATEPAPAKKDAAPAADAEPAAKDKPAAGDKDKLAAAAPEKAEKGDKAKATAKADKPASEPTPVSKPEPARKGKFTLQLSAFQSQAEADAFLATLRSAGYSATVSTAEVDGKTFIRVRTGSFGSYDEAVAAKAEFEKKVPKIAYVTRL